MGEVGDEEVEEEGDGVGWRFAPLVVEARAEVPCPNRVVMRVVEDTRGSRTRGYPFYLEGCVPSPL